MATAWVSVPICLEHKAISPASSPTDQCSVGWLAQILATPMIDFFSWRSLIQQRALEVYSFGAGMGYRKRRFSFRFQKALSSWEPAHIWRKNVLVWSAILHVVERFVLLYTQSFAKCGSVYAFLRIFCDVCCTCIMSDNVLAVGLFWRTDRSAAEVVPSEQISSSYIVRDVIALPDVLHCRGTEHGLCGGLFNLLLVLVTCMVAYCQFLTS